jgi:hypothetical protein
MILNRIKLYSYHSFLVIPFIVLFLYGHNLAQTRPEMTYRTLLYGFLLSVLLFAFFYMLIRKRLKTGVLVTIVLFAFFQYGVLYEFLERMYYQGSWPFKNIHRYLIALYALGITGLTIYVKRSSHDFIRINYFLNILIGVLILYNLILINVSNEVSVLPGQRESDTEHCQFMQGPRNNIYYIVLDGYASNDVLQKYFNFANTEFSGALKNSGFNLCDSAFSNYYYTSNSLAATLNMNYRGDKPNESHRLKDNFVFRTLKENGYRIYHIYIGYAVTSSFTAADSTIYIDGPNEFEKSLLKYTILRLDDLIGLFAHQRLKSQFVKMHEMAELRSAPRFCFMHFVAPHPPYIFNREGRRRTSRRFAEHSWEPRGFYIDQLIYVNRQITGLVNHIVQNDPDASILIQSDHGPWITASTAEAVFEARAGIFYAYRTVPQIYIPRKTSAINSFRYLFNELFGSQFPILEDKTDGKSDLYRDPIFTKKISR